MTSGPPQIRLLEITLSFPSHESRDTEIRVGLSQCWNKQTKDFKSYPTELHSFSLTVMLCLITLCLITQNCTEECHFSSSSSSLLSFGKKKKKKQAHVAACSKTTCSLYWFNVLHGVGLSKINYTTIIDRCDKTLHNNLYEVMLRKFTT